MNMDPRVAGMISPMWIAGVRLNSQDPRALFQTYGNWANAEIDHQGSVWTGSRWLTQPEIDAACSFIDEEGV